MTSMWEVHDLLTMYLRNRLWHTHTHTHTHTQGFFYMPVPPTIQLLGVKGPRNLVDQGANKKHQMLVTCPGNLFKPIGSMYGIFSYIWIKFMVNVGINIPYIDPVVKFIFVWDSFRARTWFHPALRHFAHKKIRRQIRGSFRRVV